VSAAGAVMKSSLSSKGALISASAPGTVSVLSAGTAGKVLAANPNTVSGLEWQDRAALTGSTVNAIPRVTGANALAASQVTIDANGLLTAPNIQVNGNISITGSVDGRDVGNDGAKLDGIKKDNAATFPPGTSNNTSQGYSVGSRWIDTATTPARLFVCIAATSNSATWKEVAVNDNNVITESQLATYGSDITPTGPTNDLKLGTSGLTFRSLLIGSDGRSQIRLDPTKPPGFNPTMNSTDPIVNPYARYVRMKNARGLFVGNNPVTVCAFSKQVTAGVTLAAGNDVRLQRINELGSLPFQTGTLSIDLQLRGSIKILTSLSEDSIPQFRWWLAISQGSSYDPTLKIQNGEIVADGGFIAASGIVYAPVKYPTTYNTQLYDDTHFHWRISTDLVYNTSTSEWISFAYGTVTASNRNEALGRFGESMSFPLSETLYLLKTGAISNSNSGGFAVSDTPRVALYISQSGGVGTNDHFVPYYGRARDGVTFQFGHCSGHFTPRLVDLYGDPVTDQYRKSDGTLATY
jgi:hypothetical protein